MNIRDVKVGDQIRAETEWGFGASAIEGVVEYDADRAAMVVTGDVKDNTDGHKRSFPLHDCWDIRKVEDE